jgi:HPr kinase/phosphorylase
MTAPASVLLHATTISLGGRAIMLRGVPGSGKSDLALRLLECGADCALVADDQTLLTRQGDTLLASAPSSIAGLLEVRGLGIVSLPAVRDVPLLLVADLMPHASIPRMPDPQQQVVELLGLHIARCAIDPLAASAVARLRMACKRALSVNSAAINQP